MEAGLETKFFNNRFGFDLSLYKTNSVDQIMPVNISQLPQVTIRDMLTQVKLKTRVLSLL